MFGNDRDELSHEVLYGLDKNRPRVIRRWQLDNLVGKLLTYIEATYSDPQQRKAHKDIVKQSVYNWFMNAVTMGLGDDVLEEELNLIAEKHKPAMNQFAAKTGK